MKTFVYAAAVSITATTAFAAGHGMAPMVEAEDQTVANGVVSASSVIAPANGWMVVHRTDAEMKPGPVVGYAPLREGENTDVAAILQEDVATGDMLMLMVHGEDGGMSTRRVRIHSGRQRGRPDQDRRQTGYESDYRTITTTTSDQLGPLRAGLFFISGTWPVPSQRPDFR